MAVEGVKNTEVRMSRMVGVVSVGTFDADRLSLSSAGWRDDGQAEDDLS